MGDFELRWVSPAALSPNPWNPNVMSDEMYAKEVASIAEFGFVDPITARYKTEWSWEIVDGENRWKAAMDEGMTQVPIVDLGVVSDETAEQLTIVLNETRGKPDPAKLGELLANLRAKAHLDDLLRVLPFSQADFERLTNIQKMEFPPLPTVPPLRPAQRWVERIYRIPPDAAAVIDQCVAKFREEDPTMPEWRVFELLAADYLGN